VTESVAPVQRLRRKKQCRCRDAW